MKVYSYSDKTYQLIKKLDPDKIIKKVGKYEILYKLIENETFLITNLDKPIDQLDYYDIAQFLHIAELSKFNLYSHVHFRNEKADRYLDDLIIKRKFRKINFEIKNANLKSPHNF